jgi:hypothetical protein
MVCHARLWHSQHFQGSRAPQEGREKAKGLAKPLSSCSASKNTAAEHACSSPVVGRSILPMSTLGKVPTWLMPPSQLLPPPLRLIQFFFFKESL